MINAIVDYISKKLKVSFKKKRTDKFIKLKEIGIMELTPEHPLPTTTYLYGRTIVVCPKCGNREGQIVSSYIDKLMYSCPNCKHTGELT